MTGASGSMRLVSYSWLYDLYFQLLINCTSAWQSSCKFNIP